MGESLAPQHRLLVTKFKINLHEKLKDTSVPVEKIKWIKLTNDELNGTFLENANANAKNWISDVLEDEDEEDFLQLMNYGMRFKMVLFTMLNKILEYPKES